MILLERAGWWSSVKTLTCVFGSVSLDDLIQKGQETDFITASWVVYLPWGRHTATLMGLNPDLLKMD